MISFSTLPMGCSFSTNPIEYVGTTNQQFILPNIYPWLKIEFIGKQANGVRFWCNFIDPITQNTVTIQFTCVANPTEYAELPDNSFIGSTTKYVTKCAEIIANHPMVAPNYDVVRIDNANIKLVAKQPIAALIPTDIDKTSAFLNGDVSDIYYQSTKRLGFRIVAHIYFEDEYLSNIFDKVAELSETPDSDSTFYFDIQSVIHSCIENSFELPLLPAVPDMVQKSTAIRRYFVKFREEWTGSDNPWIDTDILTAHFGGVKIADWLRQNPFAYLLSTDQFLTWFPNGKRMRESQLDWVSYMNTCGEAQKVDAKIDVYFNDSTSVLNIMAGSIDLEPWETMIISAGYNQLNLAGVSPTKRVYKWVIRAVGDHSESVSQQYYLTDEDYISSHCLVYINSFGVPESFLTIGRWIEAFQTTKSFANKSIIHAHKFVNGQEFSFNHNSTEFFKAVSGYLTKPEALALKDFLQDAPVFLVENSEMIPVSIESGSLNLTNESENLSQIEFEVRKSYKLKQVSEQITMPKLTPIIKCGISGIEFEPNGLVPADLTACSINVYYEGELVGTVPYADWAEFPTAITIEGTFIFELVIELADGSTQTVKTLYEYTMPIVEIHWEQEGAGDNSFQIAQSEWKKLFIHWGDGTEELYLPIGTGTQTILHTYPYKLTKTILKMPCFDHITRFTIIDQNCVKWDISKFTSLERVHLQNIGTESTVSLVGLNALQSIKFISMEISQIEFGFMPDVNTIDLTDCELDAAAIESVLLQIWNQRKMIVGTPVITLTGNPGAGSITSISDDIINGTGSYVGEGLDANYGYTVNL